MSECFVSGGGENKNFGILAQRMNDNSVKFSVPISNLVPNTVYLAIISFVRGGFPNTVQTAVVPVGRSASNTPTNFGASFFEADNAFYTISTNNQISKDGRDINISGNNYNYTATGYGYWSNAPSITVLSTDLIQINNL